MRNLAIWLLALGLGTGAAAAQDLAAQYRAAFQMLGPAALFRDGAADLAATEALIGRLAGRWFPANALAGDLPELRIDLVAETCERLGREIVPVQPLSFDMLTPTADGPIATRHVYLGAGHFNRLTPLHDVMTRLFGPDYATKDGQRLAAALGATTMQGQVTALMPSADILVMLNQPSGVEIWGRCP